MQPHCGQEFTVMAPDGAVVLVLDNVKLLSEATKRDNKLVIDGRELPPRRAFSLTFEGPHDPVLPPRTYPVSHATLGQFDMFLSAFRQDQDCTLYEAGFS